MRKQQIISAKTTDLKEVIKFAKTALANKVHPDNVLAEVNKRFLIPSGVRYISENKTELPRIIHQTDEKEPPNEKTVSIEILDNNTAKIVDESTAEPVESARRIVLVCDRASRNHQIELASESNGIVIDMNTWNVLSYPPAALSFNMDKKTIIDKLGEGRYKIYKVDYGTIVTLYYSGSAWAVSTANSYEIDNKIWIGTRTFRELIDEIFTTLSIDIATLNRDWCYSFGFHHNEYHPFNGATQSPTRAWFIRAVNLARFNQDATLMTAGNAIIMNKMPMQQEAAELNREAIVNASGVYTIMKEQSDHALAGYIANKQKLPCYGFILKSNDPENIADVLIESELLKCIRKLICQRPPIEIPIQKRFTWWMINASFNLETKPIFRTLFPHTEDHGQQLDETIRKIASRIVDISKRASGYKFDDSAIDRIAKFALEEMAKKDISVNRKPISIGIVMDFLMTRNFANVYAMIL